jgi:hypothetical protein
VIEAVAVGVAAVAAAAAVAVGHLDRLDPKGDCSAHDRSQLQQENEEASEPCDEEESGEESETAVRLHCRVGDAVAAASSEL